MEGFYPNEGFCGRTPLGVQEGVDEAHEGAERLGAEQGLVADLEGWAVEDAPFAADAVENGYGSMTVAIIVAAFKFCLIYANADGRIDEIISLCAPQVTLIGIEAIMDFPEGVHILTADTVGGGVGVQTGVAMIEHGPVDEANLARINVGFDDFWFCA